MADSGTVVWADVTKTLQIVRLRDLDVNTADDFFKPPIVLCATRRCGGAAFVLFTGSNNYWRERLWPVMLLMSQWVQTLVK